MPVTVVVQMEQGVITNITTDDSETTVRTIDWDEESEEYWDTHINWIIDYPFPEDIGPMLGGGENLVRLIMKARQA